MTCSHRTTYNWAEGKTVRAGGLRAHLEAAVGVLNDLGGLAELEERDDGFVIRGYSCPLAAVATDHPEVCRMAEALVAELASVEVHEHCDRGERPRCRFKVALPDGAAECGEEGR